MHRRRVAVVAGRHVHHRDGRQRTGFVIDHDRKRIGRLLFVILLRRLLGRIGKRRQLFDGKHHRPDGTVITKRSDGTCSVMKPKK